LLGDRQRRVGTRGRVSIGQVSRESLSKRGENIEDINNGGGKKIRRRQRIRIGSKKNEINNGNTDKQEVNEKNVRGRTKLVKRISEKAKKDINEKSEDKKTVIGKNNKISMIEIIQGEGNDLLSLVLENFDKVTIKELLDNKEKKVGDVVLVEGRPAVIKRRIAEDIMKTLSQGGERQMQTIRNVKISRKFQTRPGMFRKAKNARRRVRVKVRARQGISVEDIEDQLVAKNTGGIQKYSRDKKRPTRIIRGKHFNQNNQLIKMSAYRQK